MIKLFKGVVVSISDDTHSGIIKARVKGLYNSDKIGNVPDDKLPNLYPIYDTGLNNFDTPKVGEEVYVILDRDDKYSGFWIGKYSLSQDFIGKISNDYEGFKSIKYDEEEKLRLYYSRTEGLVLELDKSKVNIKDNEIFLITPDRKLHIKDGMISLGSLDKSAEPSVLGDKNVDTFNEICGEMTDMIDKLIEFTTAQSAVTKSIGYLVGLTAGYDKLLTSLPVLRAKVQATKSTTVPKTLSKKTSLD